MFLRKKGVQQRKKERGPCKILDKNRVGRLCCNFYLFLLALTLLFTLFFRRQALGGGPMAKASVSAMTTFLVLLGTSTMVDKVASTNFYLRIAQILFAGLFAVAGLILVGHLLRPDRRRLLSPFLHRSR